jgi:hypothetical protein
MYRRSRCYAETKERQRRLMEAKMRAEEEEQVRLYLSLKEP